MRFEIITIFPGFFPSIFENEILRRALAEGRVEVGIHDLRNFTHDRHRTVDDRPFGGGEGMVLKPEPLGEALGSLGIEAKAEHWLPQGLKPRSSQGIWERRVVPGHGAFGEARGSPDGGSDLATCHARESARA